MDRVVSNNWKLTKKSAANKPPVKKEKADKTLPETEEAKVEMEVGFVTEQRDLTQEIATLEFLREENPDSHISDLIDALKREVVTLNKLS